LLLDRYDSGDDGDVIAWNLCVLAAPPMASFDFKKRDIETPLPLGEGGRRPGEGLIPRRVLEQARRLRRSQTDAETYLWRLLRDRRFLGVKFRRQHSIPPFVVDFYAHEANLAIELDGGGHNEPNKQAHDEKRTQFLALQGVRVLRFWNNEVFQNTDGVLQAIYDALTPHLEQEQREQEQQEQK
jgi:very-short-patch-repair endonuclease